MGSSKVYLAGVGVASAPSKGSSAEASIASLISAATKALLDAGVTFDDIVRGVVSKSSKHALNALKAFEEGGVAMNEVEQGSELEKAFALISNRGAQNVLIIAEEESVVVAFVLVSESFLWSRSYLKDSSVLLREQSSSSGRTRKRFYDICQMTWALRGWSEVPSEKLIYQSPSNKLFELSRADGKEVPEWKTIEHKQDGKHRLGYNPSKQTEDISHEDFQAVVASEAKNSKKTDQSHFNRKGGDRAALARL